MLTGEAPYGETMVEELLPEDLWFEWVNVSFYDTKQAGRALITPDGFVYEGMRHVLEWTRISGVRNYEIYYEWTPSSRARALLIDVGRSWTLTLLIDSDTFRRGLSLDELSSPS